MTCARSRTTLDVCARHARATVLSGTRLPQRKQMRCTIVPRLLMPKFKGKRSGLFSYSYERRKHRVPLVPPACNTGRAAWRCAQAYNSGVRQLCGTNTRAAWTTDIEASDGYYHVSVRSVQKSFLSSCRVPRSRSALRSEEHPSLEPRCESPHMFTCGVFVAGTYFLPFFAQPST